LKRKASDQGKGYSKSRKSSRLLQDLIVLRIPYSTTEEEVNEYFTESCGELTFCELKYDRVTKKSRGFAFIRFKTEEAAKKALEGHHEMGGYRLYIELSKKHEETPMQLFVGRLATGTTKDDVKDYFSDFGELTDIFVPTNPFRGFGFVTYSSQEDARNVIDMSHSLLGARLNVKAAEPKKPDNKLPGYNAKSFQQESAPVQKDVVSELKDMIHTLINNRK